MHKLNRPDVLRRTLSSTNVIESCFLHVAQRNLPAIKDLNATQKKKFDAVRVSNAAKTISPGVGRGSQTKLTFSAMLR